MSDTSSSPFPGYHRQRLKSDPLYIASVWKRNSFAYRRFMGDHADLLPCLHPGAIAIDQRPPVTVPDGYVPTATISLHYADYFYDISKVILANLIGRELLGSAGDPNDFEACFVDLEKAARAHAIWVRGQILGWTQRAIENRILESGSDDPHFQRMLGRFMVGHRWMRRDEISVVGFYHPAAGVDLGEMPSTMAGWYELIDYRAGK